MHPGLKIECIFFQDKAIKCGKNIPFCPLFHSKIIEMRAAFFREKKTITDEMKTIFLNQRLFLDKFADTTEYFTAGVAK